MIDGCFTCDYVRQEVEWYGVQKYNGKHVKIRSRVLQRELTEYLNNWWWCEEAECPIMWIKGEEDWELWMSLTPMEIQSMVLPIFYAEGMVGTSGLGMGYFALQAAEKEDVARVDVYERNPHVIRYFRSRFKDREGFGKIRIIKGDVYDNLKGREYDFFFSDHYQTMCPNETITDWVRFNEDNEIQHYRFWGLERVWAHVLMQQLSEAEENGTMPDFNWLEYGEGGYFKDWLETERSIGRRVNMPIHTLYTDGPDVDYVNKVVDVAGRRVPICVA